ncbi:two component transcriptional regulator, winged helix family [Sphingopyxis sp. YR583]|jgi:DNA-binding response OmpR family regulator|uniref:response regulator n=1 Tax=Sphingopyxis sp. YR583 TaxID=1881047 RepID=UPI0008A7F486|nr:response regulator [Sphingopyxis sp. YR583]SEH12265.1 two component transcriptional regulator, winged helix family [Sphingopyxis sp. YR583]
MNSRARIIVCDDDPDLRDLLVDLLRRDGYEVEEAEDGIALRRIVPRFRPDIVVCDLMMPGEDGLSLTRWLRGEGHAAVLMLTAMGSTTDRIVGLEMGADDYLAKPFEPGELRARIKAILRRTMSANLSAGRPAARVKVGRCVVDTEMKAMFNEAGERVELTAMEYDLLYTFVTHARRPLNRDQLLELAHHKKWDPYDRSIDMRIARLRKKIEFDPAKPSVLKTVRGEGYMLIPDGE